MIRKDKNIISYNGKNYPVFPVESQNAFLEVGIVTFRYFPKDSLLIATDAFMKIFGPRRFYDNMPYSIANDIVADKDRGILYNMAKKVDSGEKKVVAEMHSKNGRIYRVTMVTIKSDKDGKPLITGGLVEDIESDTRTNALIDALGKEFGSIYYIDYKNGKTVPHRISNDIREEYGEKLKFQPPYEKIIELYIQNTVLDTEKDEMRRICSIENLKKQFAEHDVYVHDYRGIRKGKVIYCRLKVVNLSESRDLSTFVMAFSDMTKEKTTALEKMAYTDPLTGGNNYNGFKRKVRDVNKAGFIISMDIHQFKLVNSACGVAFGDKVLKKIWDTALSFCKDSCIAGHVNADHFAFYSPQESKEEIIENIKKVSDTLLRLSVEMRCPRLHPYFGITFWNPVQQIEEAYSQTTIAKHEVKDSKDTNYLFYSEEVGQKKIHEKEIEDSFPEALAGGNFEVWYQPKINPFTGKIVGAEALIRWRKNGVLVSPVDFIPLFEQDGLIRTLDEYVFATVCNFLKTRQKQNLPIVPVSVNLSRASLYYDGIVDQYKNIANDNGIAPSLVPVEITESAAASNSAVKDVIAKFKQNGFSLCVDDFGTGYSSLALLNGQNFDDLKLDKTLIDGIRDANGFKLIKHTIALAKDLGMNVTAEGVEENDQLECLKGLKCDVIQGFLFSRPVEKADFERKLDG